MKLFCRHWDTFITEDDFAEMASLGINTVRLPIGTRELQLSSKVTLTIPYLGYWSLGSPFMDGTLFEPYSSVTRASSLTDNTG